MFAVACWLIWKNRCCKAFEHTSAKLDVLVVICINNLFEGVEDGRYKHAVYRIQERGNCKWNLPPSGYMRVDVDGSVNQHQHAACGGVVRDEHGNWRGGFQTSLGFVSSTEAELHAIKEGLRLCLDKGLEKVKLYTDSIEAIQLIFSECGVAHPFDQVITDIRSLIMRRWKLEIIHCYREAIGCADIITKNGYFPDLGCVYLQDPPRLCLDYLVFDLGSFLGSTFPGSVTM